jgi:hypothetical protein
MRLHKSAFAYAKDLIKEKQVTFDERDAWSEHQPNAEEENEFIRLHGYDEYGRWHLGIDDEQDKQTKKRYKFPYGDFRTVHRCGVLSAESRAGQYKHNDIEKAAAHLHGMIEEIEASAA